MPFTDDRGVKREPRMLGAASGMYYRTPTGQPVLDATAGLWCVNAGHGCERITDAIREQAAVLDFAPTFQLGHPTAFEAAERLAGLLPPGLDHVFFTKHATPSLMEGVCNDVSIPVAPVPIK